MPNTSNPPRVLPGDTRRKPRWILRPLRLAGAVQGLVLSHKFPADDVAAYRTALETLLGLFEPSIGAMPRLGFLQLSELGRAGASLIREFGPLLDDYGLGIHPEAEPPRTWNRSDFEKLSLNDKLAPIFLEIMRVRQRPNALAAVQHKVLGSGAYAEARCPPGVDFYAEATALFKPGITNHTARMFRYHAPVLRRAAVEACSPADLQAWMCGAHLYLREAIEEDGVLLLCKGEIEPVLLRALDRNKELDDMEFLV